MIIFLLEINLRAVDFFSKDLSILGPISHISIYKFTKKACGIFLTLTNVLECSVIQMVLQAKW